LQQKNVVVGGGIAGLLAALILAERHGRDVVVVEREFEAGGLLRRFDYGEFGQFDYGMHNMYETGIAELDEILFGLLPPDEWQMLTGSQRDLAGVVYNGRVQHNSPFPDLRHLPPTDLEACIGAFFTNLDAGRPIVRNNAWEEAESRFGAPIARLIDEALQKQFGKPAAELDAFASYLTTLSRVVLFGEGAFQDLIESSLLRGRLAWPEQRSLPAKWESGRKAYYPRKYGIYRVIDALLSRLAAANVEVLTSAQVNAIDVLRDRVQAVEIIQGKALRTIDNVGQFVWTSGLPPIAKLLGAADPNMRFDPPRRTVIVNLLLKEPPAMGDLYYLYCYERGCRTFRVTNFSGYCENAPRSGGWPIAVELLLDAPLPSKEEMRQIALDELRLFGVIQSEELVIFSAVEELTSGFPMPSVLNFTGLTEIRSRLQNLGLSNLKLLGVMAADKVFFQRDVLAHTWNTLTIEETN
jgi:phytoene dehydrogenase-like protein